LSNPEEPQVANTSKEPELATPVTEVIETEADPNLGLNKALDTYRKLIEKNVDNALEPLTEKEQAKLENIYNTIPPKNTVHQHVMSRRCL